MSNPNIVYLANDSPKPSTLPTTAEPITTITSTTSNQAQTLSSEIQIPPLVIPSYSNEQGNLITECQKIYSGINPPGVASNSGYYNLAPNAVDAVRPLNYASHYIESGYCEFGFNRWEYLPPPPGEEIPILPPVPIIEMALDQYSAPNNPTQASTHSISLDTSETSKNYNQEVDKFLNKIKLNDNIESKTPIKKKLSCDCTKQKHKKPKISVKHVPMKMKKTTKTGKESLKLATAKAKPVSQNRKHIDKIKKQIDLIENEIQRRKTELSVKEQQIQNEINILQQKQPMMMVNSTNEMTTPSDDEKKILENQTFETERAKKKPQLKSVVNISQNFLKKSNKYKIDKQVRRSTNYKNGPYPLKNNSIAINKNNCSGNKNKDIFDETHIKTERFENNMKENIVISLNLQQDLNSTNKQFSISQHESTNRNETEIHLTIKISDTDNPPENQTKREENDGSVIDLSFLDDIDVDEIVECLNVADEPMDTDVTTSDNSLNLKYENNTTNPSILGPNNLKNANIEKCLQGANTNLSSTYCSEFKTEKDNETAQVAKYDSPNAIKKDNIYDEYMEIHNIINDPGFLESDQNSSLANEKSDPENDIPWTIDCLADTIDPVIIKSCTIETETLNTISEYNKEEIVLEENSDAHHVNYVTEDLKDYSSESAASLTSYSNCTEYSYCSNKNDTLEPSDSLHEDIQSDNIEQRAKNLLLSIFNNPKLIQTQTKTQLKPKLEMMSSNNTDDIENAFNIDNNNESSEITKNNIINSDEGNFDINEKTLFPDQESGNGTWICTKIESEDMDVDSIKDEKFIDNTLPVSTHNDNAKENLQTELPDNNLSKIEISDTQIVGNTNETDNDILIINTEPNLVVDLTEGSESKENSKKITLSVTEPVKEAIITKNPDANDDKNAILPQIEPLKSPRDFALALKVEQGISLFFNSELEITGIIKRGMFSDIYRAKNKNTGEVVAAKVIRNRKNINQSGVQKTEWMKQMQASIPKDKYRILYLLHGLVVDGMWCFVLEYYPLNLEEVLAERGKGFCIDALQKLARQLVSAVLLLRNHKIIHSDIKPKHILLNAATDNLKLGGFDESFQRVHANSMSCIGTVHYRAPELILGYFVGHGIDVWATGLVLFEMMANIKLFPAHTNNEVLYQQLCRVGPVPSRMLDNSKYRKNHYRGYNFFRDGMDPVYKVPPRIVYYFPTHEVIQTCVYGAYNKHWGCIRRKQREEDYATLSQFCKLLKQMLLMDPYCRIGIESVYAHGFIYE